jgi:hypothetical protein
VLTLQLGGQALDAHLLAALLAAGLRCEDAPLKRALHSSLQARAVQVADVAARCATDARNQQPMRRPPLSPPLLHSH